MTRVLLCYNFNGNFRVKGTPLYWRSNWPHQNLENLLQEYHKWRIIWPHQNLVFHFWFLMFMILMCDLWSISIMVSNRVLSLHFGSTSIGVLQNQWLKSFNNQFFYHLSWCNIYLGSLNLVVPFWGS